MILLLAILSVGVCALVAFVGYLGFVAIRGCVRYYRDNRPMATRVKPDPRAARDFDSIAMTKRMLSRD
jgi:hypothetical protein